VFSLPLLSSSLIAAALIVALSPCLHLCQSVYSSSALSYLISSLFLYSPGYFCPSCLPSFTCVFFPSFLSCHLITPSLYTPQILFSSLLLSCPSGCTEQSRSHIHQAAHRLLHCTVRLPRVRHSVRSARSAVFQWIDGPWVDNAG
jgi:hypothetical protein